MEHLNKELLIALLDLAQNDVPASVAVLARRLGASRAEVARGLNSLDERGLVRAETMRLTFFGLAHAASLRVAVRQVHAA